MSDEKDVFRMTKDLGLRLRSLRKRARLTQSELVRPAGALKVRSDQGRARKFADLALDGLNRQLRRK